MVNIRYYNFKTPWRK